MRLITPDYGNRPGSAEEDRRRALVASADAVVVWESGVDDVTDLARVAGKSLYFLGPVPGTVRTRPNADPSDPGPRPPGRLPD